MLLYAAYLSYAPVSPNPAPIPGQGLKVLIVEETSARKDLPPSQLAILTSTKLRGWLKEHNGELKTWDQDVDAKYADESWKSALSMPRESLPWIYISNGKSGFTGPLPKSVDETVALLEKYQ